MYFSDRELTVLSIIDLIIVYLFCILQVSYNLLTLIYIKRAHNQVNRWELWRAYLFALAPVVYSILPILLVLYMYQPTNAEVVNPLYPGYDFALRLIYFHLPPIVIVFIIIISWNIECSIHNKKIVGFEGLSNQQSVDCSVQIANYVKDSKNIFRKGIWKWFNKMQKQIDETNNQTQLLVYLRKIEGWYIAKQRFQFFWCTKKRYHWIKKYYYQHYITLINHLKIKLNQLNND